MARPRVIRRIAAVKGCPEAIRQYPELRDWATDFCNRAARDGYELCFADGDESSGYVGDTVTLVSEFYAMTEDEYFLQMQDYARPGTRGSGYLLGNFGEPQRWSEALVSVVVGVEFGRLFMANNNEDVDFDIWRRDRRRLKDEEFAVLARGIASSSAEDYGESVAVLVHKTPERLIARLWNAARLDIKFKPNRHGFQIVRNLD